MAVRPILKKARSFYRRAIDSLHLEEAAAPSFGVKAYYTHRVKNLAKDDTRLEDEWQLEVYQDAANEARKLDAKLVYDVGCGSGYKLVNYVTGARTVGFDLESTVKFLKQKYPTREWRISRFGDTVDEPADVVICADVIEHIPNPDQLMDFLSRLKVKKLFLSTPERTLVYGFDQSGPPGNYAHCREWTMPELKEYVSRWFNVERHYISNEAQGTQLIVGRPNDQSA